MASYVVLWIVTVALAVSLLGVLYHVGSLFNALDPVLKLKSNETRLMVGQRLPRFPLVDEEGRQRRLTEGTGCDLLIVGVQLMCDPCDALIEALRKGTLAAPADRWRMAVVVNGSSDAVQELRTRLGPSTIPVFGDETRGAWRLWEVRSPSFAIWVDGDGRMKQAWRSPTVENLQRILRGESASETMFEVVK